MFTIILLNYQGYDHTLTCVKSIQTALETLQENRFHVIVVDNASPDGSGERLKTFCQSWQGDSTSTFSLTFMQSPVNGGFSAGNNLALHDAFLSGATACWLLNNDTTITPETISELLLAHEKHPNALLGSQLHYPDGRFQEWAIGTNPVTGQLRGLRPNQNQNPQKVPALCGASLWIPKSAYERIGTMDPEFFLYCEDVAYCLHAHNHKIPVYLVPTSIVLHEKSATVGQNNPVAHYYFQRNRLYLWWMYGPWWSRLTVLPYSLFRLLRMWLKSRKSAADTQNFAMIQQAFSDFWHQRMGPYEQPSFIH